MKITLYTFCYNEEEMLPFFLNHYSKMVDKIVVYNNESTDNSIKILENYKDSLIEIRDWNTENHYAEESLIHLKNNCWKDDIESDYIIVADIDEIIYHPKFKEFLRNNRTVDCFKPMGYDMVSDNVPNDYSKEIYEIVKTGVFNEMYSKVALFKRKHVVESNYTPGAHMASFIGKQPLKTYISKGDLKLFHYKCLSYEYVVKKHKNYSERRSEFSKKHGLGFHYDFGPEKILEEFNKIKNSSNIISI